MGYRRPAVAATLIPGPLTTAVPVAAARGNGSTGEVEVSAVGEDLAVLQAEFPAYKIWQEQIAGPGPVCGPQPAPGVNPHTVITADVAELREALQPDARR